MQIYFKLQRHGSIGGRRAAESMLRLAWDVPTNTRVYPWQKGMTCKVKFAYLDPYAYPDHKYVVNKPKDSNPLIN